jgi:hypothetical protein
LLRYANLGLLGHAMGVSGAKQQVLAVDGYADTGRVSLVADMIAPGQTEDTRVTYPTGGPSRMPVYETAGTLDNAGLASATGSLVVGFGGMLTFLATDATSTGGDTTGPTVSAVAVNPSTLASPNATNTVTASATDAGSGDSTIAAAELWVDSPAPNFGGGAAMTVASPNSTTSALTGSIPAAMLQGLTQGQHRVYVRAQDQVGNWGPVSSAQLTLASTGAATTHLSVTPSPTNGSRDVTLTATGDDSAIGGTVDAAEYYIGATSGTSHPMSLGAASTVTSETATIPQATVLNLAEGAQTISVRTHDSTGLWGPFATVTLGIDRTGPGTSGTVVTPSTTDGTVGDSVDPTSLKVHASFVDPLAPVTTGISSPVAGAEGFLDSAGANGSGFVFVADDGQWNTATESGYGLIPLSQLTGLANGTHTVYVRARDAAGNWGGLASGTFTLQRGPAVLLSDYFESGTLAAWASTTGNAVNLASTAIDGSQLLRASGSNAYLTSPAFAPPAATLKAEVKLSPQSLVTGTGWVDLAQARSGSTVVAAIQYRRQTTNGIRQVRLMVRSGTTTRTSAAVTIASTATTTLRLDWSAGSARTDTLSVNGVVAQSLTNVNATNQSVDTVRLGVVGTASSGLLYLDSFIATK